MALSLLVMSGCSSPSEPLDPLLITTEALPPGSPETPYRMDLTASGGDGAYTWSIPVGTLPVGLHLQADGSLEGTPVETVASFVTVAVVSGDGQTARQPMLLEVGEGPVLLLPEWGDILDNGCSFDPENETEWSFDWEDVAGATSYRLIVRGPGATIDLIDAVVGAESRFQFEEVGGYIIDSNSQNWTWKVQAFVAGSWGGWSVTRHFDVERNNHDCP